MSGLLYYLPEKSRVERKQLAELGLAYAFGRDCTSRSVAGGPDGCDGVVLADSNRVTPNNHGYWDGRQEWRKIPGNPAGAWVGRTVNEEFRPADVARCKQLDGHLVALADGRQWLAPVARGWAEQDGELAFYNALPQLTGVDDEGEWTRGEVVRRYRPLWDVAAAWWGAIVAAERQEEEGTLKFDFAGRNDAAVVVLGTNYRVQKAEVALLGLFDNRSAEDLLMAAVDWPTMEVWTAKKKAEEAAATKEESAAGA